MNFHQELAAALSSATLGYTLGFSQDTILSAILVTLALWWVAPFIKTLFED